MDKNVLRWFGHLERMSEDRLVKKVQESEVDGVGARGRPRYRWVDGVRRALSRRSLELEDARVCARDRIEWRSIVNC